ncbi:hypothetical protein ERJ75_001729700 [Trypanosoma vivax]|nr:hypothetical protein ERJ75_001729700 [Trypanosoma vivax]
MFKRGVRPRSLRNVVTLLVYLWLLGLVALMIFLFLTVKNETKLESWLSPKDKECVRFIRRSVLETWYKQEYLVALGVPSPDTDRRKRRFLLRDTSWRYEGVATKRNNFVGEMVVLYVLARNPMHGYKYSKDLIQEAREWQDVITLPMNEGRVITSKKVGDVGDWGIYTEVGMSQKVFWWFDLALRLLPNTEYFAKGDDDAFHHAIQYIADLRVLPRRGIYWARHGQIDVKDKFYCGRGLLYTLSRDLVEKLVSFKPIRRLAFIPFEMSKWGLFNNAAMRHEDRMVGVTLDKLRDDDFLYVHESCCRFIVLNGGECEPPKSSNFVVIHGVTEDGYKKYMDLYSNYTVPVPTRFVRSSRGLEALC